MTYAGMVFYEMERGTDLVTFTSTKDLNALTKVWNIEYIMH